MGKQVDRKTDGLTRIHKNLLQGRDPMTKPSENTTFHTLWCFCIPPASNVRTLHFMQCRSRMYFGTLWTTWAPKKICPNVFTTFLPYIYYVKNEIKYSLWKFKNKNIFKRHKYPSPNASSIKYFWTLTYNHWGFLGITKLSNP